MPFIQSAELGRKVCDPPLKGCDLKLRYFIVREERKDSLVLNELPKFLEAEGREILLPTEPSQG